MAESRGVLNTLAEAAQQAREAGLIHVSDVEPGIRRRRVGKGFVYLDPAGARIRDAATLERIRALAVPPAYTEVWICPHARGHLQATGRDARRRKQYRYHRQWSAVRGNGKFTRIVAFGKALPRLRRRVRADLALPGYPRAKVLAIVVALMGATLVRVGNAGYVRDNGSFGLTTLRNRHVEFVRGDRVRLRFTGKGGQVQDVAVDDRRLVRLVRACRQLPGQALFQYRDDDGQLHPVDSGAVNDYLREAMGEAFTAKDFRTWGGTLAAFQQLAAIPVPMRGGERALARVGQTVTEAVAGMLGNTVAVCRKAYIDPCVFEGWRDGRLARCANGARGARQWERAALRFLERAHRDAAGAAAGGRQPRKAATKR
ncbi:DNA topoisomerase IB [Pseudoxanthomonas sp.]|uniref:DNA topoisomerase IB n=1 Tax=Pseudoxanthomonas sp. TaxID=1871049 RepID=UPI003F7DF405